MERNLVWAMGSTAASKTGIAFSAQSFDPADGVTFRANRGIARSWLWGGVGEVAGGFYTNGGVKNLVLTGNTWADQSLTAAIWDTPWPVACAG